MAILIVDRDPRSCDTLQSILRKLGHVKIRAVRSDDQALEILDRSSQVGAILYEISTGARGTLLSALERPPFDYIPFVAMLSQGVPVLSRWQLGRRRPRIDGFISKPFGKTALLRALFSAMETCSRRHATLLYIGCDRLAIAELSAAIQRGAGFWKKLVVSENQAALSEVLPNVGRELGGVFIDPESCSIPTTAQWVARLRKSPNGRRVSVFSLSRDPRVARCFRASGSLFVDRPVKPSGWSHLLLHLSQRSVNQWRLKTVSLKFREAIDPERAFALKAEFKGLTNRTFPCPEAEWRIGQILQDTGSDQEAMEHYWASLALNPFYPKSYLKLFELLRAPERREQLLSTVELAALYCGGHPQIARRIVELQASLK